MKRRLLVRRSLGEGGILFALLLVALLGGLAWFLFHQPPEPAYQGKPLSAWLDAAYGPLDKQGLKADEALRQIGTNSLPTLLRMLKARDSKFKLLLIGFFQKQHLIKIHFRTAEFQRTEATSALRSLGPAAKPALPELIQLYQERDPHAPLRVIFNSSGDRWTITSIFASMGPAARDAIPVLLPDTTNSKLYIRMLATNTIGAIAPDFFRAKNK